MLIDGHEYTLYKDYDRGNYHLLNFGGKITYLDEHVKLILINPLDKIMPDLLSNTLGLIATTAICAGISAASTHLRGERTTGQDKQTFIEFVTKYMDPRLQQQAVSGMTWAEWLYSDMRCGLAHCFTIDSGGIEVQVNKYLKIKSSGPEINPHDFLKDFSQGWNKYLAVVRKDGQGNGLGVLFEKRFAEVFHD